MQHPAFNLIRAVVGEVVDEREHRREAILGSPVGNVGIDDERIVVLTRKLCSVLPLSHIREPRVHSLSVGLHQFARLLVRELHQALLGEIPFAIGEELPVAHIGLVEDELADHARESSRREPSAYIHLPKTISGVEIAKRRRAVAIGAAVEVKHPELIETRRDVLFEARVEDITLGFTASAENEDPEEPG